MHHADNIIGYSQQSEPNPTNSSNGRQRQTVLSARLDANTYNKVLLRVHPSADNTRRFYEMEASSYLRDQSPLRVSLSQQMRAASRVTDVNAVNNNDSFYAEDRSVSTASSGAMNSPGARSSYRKSELDVNVLCQRVDSMLGRQGSTSSQTSAVPRRANADSLDDQNQIHAGGITFSRSRQPVNVTLSPAKFQHEASGGFASSSNVYYAAAANSVMAKGDYLNYDSGPAYNRASPGLRTYESYDTNASYRPIDDSSSPEAEPSEEPIRCVSPLPESIARKLYDGTFESCVKPAIPKAFKFFMEQRVENVIKQYRERQKRMMQLSRELSRCRLPSQVHCGMRRLLIQKESQYLRLRRQRLDQRMFDRIKTIGQGAFGDVMLVRKKDTRLLYAMKALRKSDVIQKNQAAHVKAERDILSEADNEWVVKLYYSFQDSNNLFFILEYIPGGDLMALLIKKGIFDEPLAKFYASELVEAIDSVHKLKFIHRDIKPDNILIDKDGHIKLTDFGLCTGFRWTHQSKYYRHPAHEKQDSFDLLQDGSMKERVTANKLLDYRHEMQRNRAEAHSLVGTPNYIAPEVLQRIEKLVAGHTQACDWWSVGVIMYEMLVGCPPFHADTPEETQAKIIRWRYNLYIPPNRMSAEAEKLIRGLLTDAANRLGSAGGSGQIKQHPFFENMDFSKLRKLPAPFIPPIQHETDTSNFDPVPAECERDFDSQSQTSNGPADHAFYEFTFRRFFEPDGHGCPTLRLGDIKRSGIR